MTGAIYDLLGRVGQKPKPVQPSPNVIVHTIDDRSIEGVQLRRDAAGILLGAPKMLGEGADRDVPLAGEVWIPIINVRMVQEAR